MKQNKLVVPGQTIWERSAALCWPVDLVAQPH